MAKVELYLGRSYDVDSSWVRKLVIPWTIVADFGGGDFDYNYLCGGIADSIARYLTGKDKQVAVCAKRSPESLVECAGSGREIFERKEMSAGKVGKISRRLRDLGVVVE